MTKRTVKSRKTTAMHPETGEIRKVIVHSDGTKHFDLGCASVPVRDESWIEEPSGSKLKALKWGAIWLVVVVGAAYIDSLGWKS